MGTQDAHTIARVYAAIAALYVVGTLGAILFARSDALPPALRALVTAPLFPVAASLVFVATFFTLVVTKGETYSRAALLATFTFTAGSASFAAIPYH
jgi:hypothetical protein